MCPTCPTYSMGERTYGRIVRREQMFRPALHPSIRFTLRGCFSQTAPEVGGLRQEFLRPLVSAGDCASFRSRSSLPYRAELGTPEVGLSLCARRQPSALRSSSLKTGPSRSFLTESFSRKAARVSALPASSASSTRASSVAAPSPAPWDA